jgi:pyruvate dehydrogenase (quinone)
MPPAIVLDNATTATSDALRRNGSVDFVHVRHEEWGVFAAVADARLTGQPVAVCGTVGPGVVHLVNGLLDARKEGAPVIAIAGDTESSMLDSDTVEELNPYIFFAAADAPAGSLRVALPATMPNVASASDLAAMAALINEAETVAVFGGDGCEQAQAEVRALAGKLNAPVGYSLKGKQWLERCSARSHGRPWPTPRRTRSARSWRSPAGRPSPCAVTAASPCSGWATC